MTFSECCFERLIWCTRNRALLPLSIYGGCSSWPARGQVFRSLPPLTVLCQYRHRRHTQSSVPWPAGFGAPCEVRADGGRSWGGRPASHNDAPKTSECRRGGRGISGVGMPPPLKFTFALRFQAHQFIVTTRIAAVFLLHRDRGTSHRFHFPTDLPSLPSSLLVSLQLLQQWITLCFQRSICKTLIPQPTQCFESFLRYGKG